MTRFSGRRTPLSADDMRLWRQAMRDVEPLQGTDAITETLLTEAVTEMFGDPISESRFAESLRTGSTVVPPPVAPAAPVAARPERLPVRTQKTGEGRGAESLPRLEVGRSAGLDRRTDARLRRGKLTIEGRIDLHGLTRARAHTALTAFLHRAQLDGKRCVLVITGKGSGRGEVDEPLRGVLRQAVPNWLDQPPLRPMVVAVHRAQPCDGGDGALYVLLKKFVR